MSLTNDVSAVTPDGKGPQDVPLVPCTLATMLVLGSICACTCGVRTSHGIFCDAVTFVPPHDMLLVAFSPLICKV